MSEEICVTEGLLNGGGPDAINVSLRMSDQPGPRFIEAWLSNFGASNVHILSGSLTLAQCQGQLERGFTDMIMTVPSAGVGRRRLPTNVSNVTLFFEAVNNSGQAELVTIRIVK